MKTNNFLFAVLLLVFLSTNLCAQTGIQKTLIDTVLLGDSNKVFFDFPGEVNIQTWERDYIKVVIDLKTNLENNNVFEYLIESGRYLIKKDYNTYYFMVLNLENLKEEITVNKIALEESFKFYVMVPWDIDIGVVNAKEMTLNKNIAEEDCNILLSYQIKE